MVPSAWVALVGPEVEENLSLRHLAASLERAGTPVEIFPFNRAADVPQLVGALCKEPQPMVAALSLSFQWRAEDVLALAMALREHGYRGHITSGGHFASFAWREVMGDFPEIDTLCRFESEETLCELCSEVAQGHDLHHIRGLVLRDSDGQPYLTSARESPDLAKLPWPDRRGPSGSCLGHSIAALISSRGCYANCAFCCIATLHKNSSPKERHRLRPVDDVADEMAFLHHERGAEIFIFHDDNFFLPRHDESLARVNALADALDARRVHRYATVVKARPNDVTEPLFTVMRQRLRLLRSFLGVESATHQGCKTLGRGVTPPTGAAALKTLTELGIYVCFNMLVFDPDASLDGLLSNMRFIEANGEHPSNFGRVELYAGTPLLDRMQREGRAVGDYLGWNYDQATPSMQRAFELTMKAFHERNFSTRSLANRLQSTRFDVEVARHFHPELFRKEWLEAAKSLNRQLSSSSAAAVRHIVEHVRHGDDESVDASFIEAVVEQNRSFDIKIHAEATELEREVAKAVGVRCNHAPSKGFPVARTDTSPAHERTTWVRENASP